MVASPDTLPTLDLKGISFLRPGIFNGDRYSDADLDAMVSDTNELIAKGIFTPRLKIGHNQQQALLASDEMPADGGVLRLYRRGREVLLDASKVPAKLARLIRAGAYPQRSAEVWIDGVNFEGKQYRKVLKALAFLGATVPAVSSLDDIAARYANDQPAATGIPSIASYSDEQGKVSVTLMDADEPEPRGQTARLAAAPDASDFGGDKHPGHPAVTGTHSGLHAAHGASDGEAADGQDAQHSHEHTHDGDANHAPSSDAHPHSANMADKVKGGSDTPPKGYPSDSSQYGDPAHHKYPLDAKHIKAAVGYFNHKGQRAAGGYSTSQWATIGRKIASAANKLIGKGHSFQGGTIAIASENAREYAMGDQWSHDEIRMAVQDELQEHFPRVYDSSGMPPSGVMADGPSADIEDLYGNGEDGSFVVVWDQDADELWQIPFTCDQNSGECEFTGAATKVRVSYQPFSGATQAPAEDEEGEGAVSYSQAHAALPHDITPSYDTTSPRVSDMATDQKKTPDEGDDTPDTGGGDGGDDGGSYAAMERMLSELAAGMEVVKGKRGVTMARTMHGLLAKSLAAMKGQWPDIDTQGNTDGSEGPEGETPAEQDAGSGKDPPHGQRSLAFEEETMTTGTVEDRLALYERRERERDQKLAMLERQAIEREQAKDDRIAELEKRDFDREAKAAVEAAINNHKLTPKMRDVGLRMYAKDPETFAALVDVAPEAWYTGEQGSAGSPGKPPEDEVKELSREEQEIAAKLGLDPATVQARKNDNRSLAARRADNRKARGLVTA